MIQLFFIKGWIINLQEKLDQDPKKCCHDTANSRNVSPARTSAKGSVKTPPASLIRRSLEDLDVFDKPELGDTSYFKHIFLTNRFNDFFFCGGGVVVKDLEVPITSKFSRNFLWRPRRNGMSRPNAAKLRVKKCLCGNGCQHTTLLESSAEVVLLWDALRLQSIEPCVMGNQDWTLKSYLETS